MSSMCPGRRRPGRSLWRPGRVAATVGLCGGALLICGCGAGGGVHSARSKPPMAPTHTVVSGGRAPLAPTETAPASGSQVLTIDYANGIITPSLITVNAGTTVRWINQDRVAHNVVSTSGPAHFTSPTLRFDGTFEYTFSTPGVVTYESSLQPKAMQGTITVAKA